MRFEVPQFIDVEDKIIGPLTFRQFAYLGGGAGLCYISIKLLPTYANFILVPALGGFAVALAFVKINSKPFIDVVQAFILFTLRGKLYIWKKENVIKKKEKVAEIVQARARAPQITESRLHDIAWGLDVLNSKR